jgi:hypothetical protein
MRWRFVCLGALAWPLFACGGEVKESAEDVRSRKERMYCESLDRFECPAKPQSLEQCMIVADSERNDAELTGCLAEYDARLECFTKVGFECLGARLLVHASGCTDAGDAFFRCQSGT